MNVNIGHKQCTFKFLIDGDKFGSKNLGSNYISTKLLPDYALLHTVTTAA